MEGGGEGRGGQRGGEGRGEGEEGNGEGREGEGRGREEEAEEGRGREGKAEEGRGRALPRVTKPEEIGLAAGHPFSPLLLVAACGSHHEAERNC